MKRRMAAFDSRDLLALLGLLLLGTGAGLVYLPAALIVVGALLLVLAVWRA